MIAIDLNPVMLRISKKLISDMAVYIQNDNKKPESGGILVGYFQENNSYVITDVTFPGDGDRQSRFGFVRSKKKAQKALNQFFEKSNGKKIYLGEWHTHPEDIPTPSNTDISSIKNRIQNDQINAETIFMVIFGRKSLYISSVVKKGILMERKIPYYEIKSNTDKTFFTL